jgi:hypothetical protein
MPYDREQMLDCLGRLNERLGKYGFRKGKYVVLAGGAMLLHSPHVEPLLREPLRTTTNDLDISVNPEVFQKLRANAGKIGAAYRSGGFRKHEQLIIRGPRGDVEISAGGMSIIGNAPVEIDGHCAQSLSDILAFKRKMNRPKDAEDIRLLDAAVKRQKLLHP